MATSLDRLLNVADFETEAERLLPAASWAYLSTGAGDEVSLADNVAAYGRWRLRPRVLVDVSEVSAATTVLGEPVSMPVLVAPTASHRLFHPDGEIATARAAAAAGTIFCISAASSSGARDIAAEATGPRRQWFQMSWYTDIGLSKELVAQAEEIGCGALVLTVDSPIPGRRERAQRGGHVLPEMTLLREALGDRADTLAPGTFLTIDPSLTWRRLEEIASGTSLPVVVKGVLTAEDALLAANHGAQAISVSNHGARQLDSVQATLDALPEVADAVGSSVEVLVDGGVRRGADVVKALALGARAVLIGRPVVYGLAVGGDVGAQRVLELIRDDLMNVLTLMGCPTPDAVARAHIVEAR